MLGILSLLFMSNIIFFQVSRLIYTNSGHAVFALASNTVHKLWKWARNSQNLTGKDGYNALLPTQTEFPYYSHCSDITQSPCLFTSSNSNANLNQTHHCWTKSAIRCLVIIVFDVLRFDFVALSTSFKVSKPWMDKLGVLQEQASQKPLSARIFKAIADPPPQVCNI